MDHKECVFDLLNLGCGNRVLSGWTNVDFVKTSPGVVAHDLCKPLPFADHTFSIVYHSHVLEHFAPEEGKRLLLECLRVLRPGGLLRVVVPDLEFLCRNYLEALRQVIDKPSNQDAIHQHDWSVICLIDQMVRTRSGGAMGAFVDSGKIPDFVRNWLGSEWQSRRPVSPCPNSDQSSFAKKLSVLLQQQRANLLRRMRHIAGVTDDEYALLRFRRRGELHRWMYDQSSLARLLDEVGFSNCSIVDAHTSSFPEWNQHSWLDVDNSVPRKPESLYMEAHKS